MKLTQISPSVITEDRYDDRRSAMQDDSDDKLDDYMDQAIKNDFVQLYDILAGPLDLEEDDWLEFMSFGPEGADAEEYYVDKYDMKQFMQVVNSGNARKAWGAIQSTAEIKAERSDDYAFQMANDE